MRYHALICISFLCVAGAGLAFANDQSDTSTPRHTADVIQTGTTISWQEKAKRRPIISSTEKMLNYTVISTTTPDSYTTGNKSAGNLTHAQQGRRASGLHFMFGRGTLYNLPLYLTPFVIVFGVVGNTLAFIVLFRFVKEQRSTSDLYLCALALFDIGGLLFSTLLFWLSSFLRLELYFSGENRLLDIFLGSYGACQTWFYLSFFFRYCSHWMVVLFTVERYYIVSRPFEVGKFTLKRAVIKTVALICISAIINIVAFWMFDKRVTPSGNFCKWGEVFFIASSIHVCMLCLVPSVIIIIFNISIVHSLYSHRKEDPRVTSGNDAKDREIQVTWRLLAVSITFVVLTFPFMVIALYRNVLRLQGVRHFSELVSDFYSVAAFLYMCNYSVNILCYCGTGARFRSALMDLLCCKTRICCKTKTQDGVTNANV